MARARGIGRITLVPVLFANGRTHTEMPYTTRRLKVARIQLISHFTLSEMGTRHKKFRNGKR